MNTNVYTLFDKAMKREERRVLDSQDEMNNIIYKSETNKSDVIKKN